MITYHDDHRGMQPNQRLTDLPQCSRMEREVSYACYALGSQHSAIEGGGLRDATKPRLNIKKQRGCSGWILWIWGMGNLRKYLETSRYIWECVQIYGNE